LENEENVHLNSSKLNRLIDYAAQHPEVLPEICDYVETLFKSFKNSEKIGSLTVCLSIIRGLLIKCIEINLINVIQPTIVNILFQLFQSSNILIVDKSANFFFEYSELCSRLDFSVFVKPILDVCSKEDNAISNSETNSEDVSQVQIWYFIVYMIPLSYTSVYSPPPTYSLVLLFRTTTCFVD
jgi:hypothetical protein